MTDKKNLKTNLTLGQVSVCNSAVTDRESEGGKQEAKQVNMNQHVA